MDKQIGAPGHGKYSVDGLNERHKIYLREKVNRSSQSLKTTCEGLGMFHSAPNKSTVSYE